MAKVELICAYCKKVSLIEKKGASKRRFCSRQCSGLSQSNRLTVSCVICKKEITRKNSDIGIKNYCSVSCRNEGLRGKTRRLKEYHKYNCLQCRKSVEVMPSRRFNSDGTEKKFCSKDCSYEYQRSIFVSSEIEISCDNCDEKLYRTKSHIKEKNYCSVKCMGEHYSKEKLFTGENSGTWNGGKLTYYGDSWSNARRQCRERDDYTCQDCGITEEEYQMELSVHHLIPFVCFEDHNRANDLDNLVSICEPCHRKRHSGDNHPSKFSQTYSI